MARLLLLASASLFVASMISGCGDTAQPPSDGGGGDSGAGDGGGDGGSDGGGGDGGVDLTHLGEPCTNGACPAGLQPITYCGFGGCSNGQLCSCEIPCSFDAGACPPGTTCSIISDGPGQVCVKN
jgi:hypothetical protein